MAEKALLDAVTAGIENLGETPPAGDDNARAEADTSAGSGDAGEAHTDGGNADASGETGGDAGEVSGSEGAPDEEGTEGKGGDSEGKEGSAGAGKPKEGEAAKAGAAGAAPKAEGDATKGSLDPVKQRDAHINGPIDQRLKESTRDRITFLANEVKKQDGMLAQANTLFDAIDDTGMSPDELANMLGYARARHHGTAEQKKQAYTFLKEELRAIALELGETDTVDFLEDHQDLKDAVANNQITEAHAKELAVARSRAKVATDTAAATDQQTQAQREHAAGRQALSAAGGEFAQKDGQAVFAAKLATLTPILKPILAQLHPSKWAETFKNAYAALPKPAPAVAPVAAKTPQPMRPGTPAGGGKKEPQSMKDAVFAAFDSTGD